MHVCICTSLLEPQADQHACLTHSLVWGMKMFQFHMIFKVYLPPNHVLDLVCHTRLTEIIHFSHLQVEDTKDVKNHFDIKACVFS